MNRLIAGTRWLVPMLVILAALALLFGCGGKAEVAQKYHCPMHPTYVSDKPGDCPICGMKLVPIPKGRATGSGGGGAPGTGGPSGAPSTGTGAASSSPSPAGSGQKILYYRNPMDPSVTSPVPMKDPMGMDYVPVYAGQAASPGGVEGYATVATGAEGVQLAGVQTAVAEKGTVVRTVRAVGEVKADETRVRQVSLKAGGWVERLFVNSSGQAVTRGTPLLSIYSPELLASQKEFLEASAAAARFSDSDLPEVREGGADLLDAARRRLELFDVPEGFIATLEKTRQPQRTITLNAPVSGFVTAKDVLEGARVEPGTPLFSIADLSRVWVEADVYEYEAAAVRVGQEATLSLAYEPGKRLAGRVSYVYPYLNTDTRTLRVRFELDNPGQRLKPGMYANVELALESAEGIKVPDSAVMDSGTRKLVFVEAAPGRFEPRAVTVGLRADGTALLLSGVRDGERVVVSSNFLLDSESRIQAAVTAASDTSGGERR